MVWVWCGRTLNVNDALLENVLKGLWVLELLLDLGNDGLRKLLLLALLNLSLVTHPRVENALGLSGKGGGLLQLENLGLNLGSLLRRVSNLHRRQSIYKTHLGNLEKRPGDVDDTSHLLDVLDAGVDGLGVVGASRVQDITDLADLSLGPSGVCWSKVLANSEEDGEERETHDGLLVDDIVLVAESEDGRAGSGREDGGLGDQGVAWKRIENRLGLLLWLLSGDARVVSGGAGQSRKGSNRCGWSETCGPCVAVSTSPPKASIDSSSIARDWDYIPRAVFATRDAIVMRGGMMQSLWSCREEREPTLKLPRFGSE